MLFNEKGDARNYSRGRRSRSDFIGPRRESDRREDAKELYQYVQVQENWLVPIHTETQELFLEYKDPWNEEEMGATRF
ncbi:hypothetical protein [Priestia endophytica]|uniref:hypothetical protein n=1 Tax=Priestia endophytica TaxID=135735 RepID=UPI00203DC49A|nr:hypothetical protein [Priestia endophytica]MCM3537405.1 hypothetical protein [Priestia endophytica]